MKNISYALAMLLASFSQGCVDDCHDQYYYDPDNVNSAILASMENASSHIEEWTTHKPIFIADKDAGYCKLEFLYNGEQITENDKAIGYSHNWTKNIQVEITENHGMNIRVIQHEILHTYGLKHIKNAAGIMYYKAGYLWTDEDQKECEEQGVCPIH